ncbi:hypothetical protein D3C81_1900040 [compost metagenome]
MESTLTPSAFSAAGGFASSAAAASALAGGNSIARAASPGWAPPGRANDCAIPPITGAMFWPALAIINGPAAGICFGAASAPNIDLPR